MAEAVRLTVRPGVTLTALQTEQFKTDVLSLSLLRPLSREEAGLSALLPQVLCRGSRTYPDMTRLAARLEALYGARLEPAVRKKGEVQCVGLTADFVDGAYLPARPDQLRDMAALMGEILLDPAGGGEFLPAYVTGERAVLADRIRAERNHKPTYAVRRMLALMCAGEAYGAHELGEAHAVEALEPEALWAHYRAVLARSRVALFYAGPRPPDEAADIWRGALDALPRAASFDRADTRVVRTAAARREHEENMDIAQGTLILGMRLGVAAGDAQYPAALLAAAVYGGTTTSKLFLSVRERLSLAYYASAWLEGHKGILVVSSGIEAKNRAAAEAEILRQWTAVAEGTISDEELEAARLSLIHRLRAAADRPDRLEDHFLGQAAAGRTEGPDALAERLRGVSRAEVAAVAAGGAWDTVYFLRGEETHE
ncbi:MAG: insulinase family protein [Oscillospiraceae bacterium]|jgi:predicted Zn-dependent peptidase|nr:insulinase family protein [Oscillospiraceae bacterium]